MPPTVAPAHERDAVWSEVRERLRSTLNGQTFKFAFSGARPVMLADDRIVLAVDTELLRQWIRQRYLPLLRDALFEIRGSDLEVEITVEAGPDAEEPSPEQELIPAEQPRGPMASLQPRRPSGLQPRFTFEAFVTGPSNRFAQAAALAVAEAPAKAYNPLFIYGGVGLGKTHLLHAIGHQAAEAGQTVLYLSSERFTNDLIGSIRTNRTEEFRDRYRTIDVLLIDDIQFIAGKETTQEEFFHTFNALHESNRQIVLCSDRPPKSITTLEDRLRTRFEWGLIADVTTPDFEHRVAILQAKAATLTVDVPRDVLDYVARKVQSNIRELEGSLNRIVALSGLTGQPITLESAAAALGDILDSPERRFITGPQIVALVARYYRAEERALRGKQRDRETVLPRQIAMHLMRQETEMSLVEIGRELGGRDHSTILHGCDKIAGDLQTDARLRRDINAIRQLLYDDARP